MPGWMKGTHFHMQARVFLHTYMHAAFWAIPAQNVGVLVSSSRTLSHESILRFLQALQPEIRLHYHQLHATCTAGPLATRARKRCSSCHSLGTWGAGWGQQEWPQPPLNTLPHTLGSTASMHVHGFDDLQWYVCEGGGCCWSARKSTTYFLRNK